MSIEKKSSEKKTSEQKEEKVAAPKTKSFTLTSRTFINGSWIEKGVKVDLTEEGRKSFKSKHRI
jgi:hypothetical protein